MNKTALMESQTKEKAAEKAMKRIREEKTRKKDDKSVDHVLKALDSLGSPEEKLGAMCQKYAEMFNDHRLLQNAVKQAEKKNTLLQKEKEQLQAEHSKAILTRSRLENLCRELQRQNKAVKEECMLKMREEGEKKREVAAKFHSMLSEIGSLLAQNSDKNAKLRDDNLDMSMRLKSVCDQFEKKEQHVENLAKQMQLEMQLADAKLAKAKMEMDIEKETLQKEKQQLLIELAEYKRKICEMKASEIALREQITMYSEKYEEFHKALLQSNSAIGDFKAEMERMTKHIRRLEKETATWKSRYDAAQRTLAEVTQGKIRSDEALGLAQRRLNALQGICRGLQDQCRQLRGEKKDDPQTEENYKQLEAQIKEVESNTSDLDNKPCPKSVSFERTEGGESNVDDQNEMESLNSKSINTSEELVTVGALEESAHENGSDNKFTNINYSTQEIDVADSLPEGNHIDTITKNNVNDELKDGNRSEGNIDEYSSLKSSEDSSMKENHEFENDGLKPETLILFNEGKRDGNISDQGNNKSNEEYRLESVSKNESEYSRLNEESQLETENINDILHDISNNTIDESSLAEKGSSSIENEGIDVLLNAVTLHKDWNQLNGEKTTDESSSIDIEIENSINSLEEGSNKITCSPEEANQTKSKKKRKMKK